MSIEAMKRALDVLVALDTLFSPVARDSTQRVWINEAKESIEALRTAIQQAESAEAQTKTEEPVHALLDNANPLLVFAIESEMGVYQEHEIPTAARNAIKASKTYTNPAPGVPEFSRIAKRKLTELQEQGFAITGYAIQRAAVRGFIDGSGFVGWWQGETVPGVPDDVVRDAQRYRWLRDFDHWPAPFASSQEPEPVRGADLDAAIDAAMLAAKDASA